MAGSIRRRAAALSMAVISALLTILGAQAIASPVQAVPCGAPCAPPVTKYSVVDEHTYPNSTLYEMGAVGQCKNAGGTCHIMVTETRTTTVQASLGASTSYVAGQIGFSLSKSSSTGVTCDTPRKLKSGEVYRAYLIGTEKMYKVKKTTSSYYGTTSETSSWLFARQPAGAAIACFIE